MKRFLGILLRTFLVVMLYPGNIYSQVEQPNVLFILVDDLRPNLGCYGDPYAVTPHIDALGQKGVKFNRAYCQQAVCNPSRTSMLTGLRPDETGVTDLETHFRDNLPDVTTLPQLFKNNGYLTLGAGKVYHATPFIVDSLSWTRPIPAYETRSYLLPENQIGKRKQNATEAADVDDFAYGDGKIVATTLQHLAEAKDSGRPFFIAMGLNKPHLPFCAPKKYWDLYAEKKFKIPNRERPEGSPDLAFHNWDELRGYRDIPDSGPLSPEKEVQLIHGYYACTSYADALVGRVINRLEELGLAENTIIVLWGDHGYHLGEQDTWCKSTNFELDARVPLIISAPGMEGNGQSCNAIVESLDVYPTLSDLCQLESGSSVSGISLSPLLENPSSNWDHIAFHQFIRPMSALRSGKITHIGYSARTDEWRCTYWYDLQLDKIVEKELYHLDGNNLEMENLAGHPGYTKIEAKLASLIKEYIKGKYSKHR
jgi:iduronate 2-sulfatase